MTISSEVIYQHSVLPIARHRSDRTEVHDVEGRATRVKYIVDLFSAGPITTIH